MQLSLRRIGGMGSFPAKIIELTIVVNGTTVIEDVTDLKGRVDSSLIDDLRGIADDLEAQNSLLDEKLNPAE
jgi:hypothetical protein